MKHILHTKALVGLMIFMAGTVVVACQKDPLDEFNPKTETVIKSPTERMQVYLMEELSLQALLQEFPLTRIWKTPALQGAFSCSSLKPAGIRVIIQARMRSRTRLKQARQNKTLQNSKNNL